MSNFCANQGPILTPKIILIVLLKKELMIINNTPVHYAAFYGHLDIVEYLYDHGSDPQALNKMIYIMFLCKRLCILLHMRDI